MSTTEQTEYTTNGEMFAILEAMAAFRDEFEQIEELDQPLKAHTVAYFRGLLASANQTLDTFEVHGDAKGEEDGEEDGEDEEEFEPSMSLDRKEMGDGKAVTCLGEIGKVKLNKETGEHTIEWGEREEKPVKLVAKSDESPAHFRVGQSSKQYAHNCADVYFQNPDKEGRRFDIGESHWEKVLAANAGQKCYRVMEVTEGAETAE